MLAVRVVERGIRGRPMAVGAASSMLTALMSFVLCVDDASGSQHRHSRGECSIEQTAAVASAAPTASPAHVSVVETVAGFRIIASQHWKGIARNAAGC